MKAYKKKKLLKQKQKKLFLKRAELQTELNKLDASLGRVREKLIAIEDGSVDVEFDDTDHFQPVQEIV